MLQQLFCLVLLLKLCLAEDIIYQTKLGAVRGNVVHLNNRNQTQTVHEFRGIRYGKSPTGNLRFRLPEAEGAWNETDIYNATHYGHACYQPNVFDVDSDVKEAEDCLFLNVWTPKSAETPTGNNTKLPVLVWIHGGGFTGGSASTWKYSGEWIAGLGQVVVVSFNYRLATLDFLYSGLNGPDSHLDAPGNMALYDQILALKWIRDNIDDYGGDAEHVTIFGESAGSWSVGLLVTSPLARGLFSRAIMESGAYSRKATISPETDPVKQALNLAKHFNCIHENATEMTSEAMDCLREQDPKKIVKFSTINAPIFNTEIFPYRPREAFEKGAVNPGLDLMFGAVNGESNGVVAGLMPDIFGPFAKPDKLTKSLAKTLLQTYFLMMTGDSEIGKKAGDFYIDPLNENDKEVLRWTVGEVLSDAVLICPTILFGHYYADFSNSSALYSFLFTHRAEVTWAPGNGCKGWMGVCHAEDLVFVFGLPLKHPDAGYSDEDIQLSRDVIQAWTDFAKNRKLRSDWTEAIDHTKENPSVSYFELNPSRYRMVEDAYSGRCETFWKPYVLNSTLNLSSFNFY